MAPKRLDVQRVELLILSLQERGYLMHPHTLLCVPIPRCTNIPNPSPNLNPIKFLRCILHGLVFSPLGLVHNHTYHTYHT